MFRFAPLLAGTLSLALLVTTACTTGSAATQTGGSPAAQQLTVTVGNSMSFDPSTMTVHAGQPVELTLDNTGAMPHDFSLTEGVSEPVKIAASGGQRASGTFTIETPGTYAFDCSMPGHAAAGMRGTITAQ
jgi:nitrite reductase (NO-forming)